jgi:hypothetical protein
MVESSGRVLNDYYPTDPKITQALIEIAGHLIENGDLIIDPAAGDGAIIRVLNESLDVLTIGNEPYPDADGNYWFGSRLDASDPASWLEFDRLLDDANFDGGIDWTIANTPFDKDLMLPILQNAYKHSRKGVMFLARLSWLEPCPTVLKSLYGGKTLKEWGLLDNRSDWLESISDQLRYLAVLNPRPRFKKGPNSDNVTVAWVIVDKRFSWRSLGLNPPYQLIRNWK